MTKKLIAIVLAVLMLVAVLAACGGENTTPSDNSTPSNNTTPSDNDKKDDEKKDDAPAQEYTQTYALKYSSFAPEGHPTNLTIEVPLKELIEKESNGRISVEIYSAGALTTQASTLEGIMSGVTDMGYDAPAYYAGVYPRIELFTTPGLYYGDEDQQNALFYEFNEAYPSQNFEDNFYLLAWQPSPLTLFVSNKPMQTWNDIQGFSLRVPGDKVPYFEAIGCAPVVMSTADVYEAIRLNVIDGCAVAIQAVNTTSIYELCDYATRWYGATGMTGWYFSKEAYDDMDPEAQAVMDKARDWMRDGMWKEDNAVQLKIAEENVFGGNPNFKYLDFDEDCVQRMAEAAEPVLEAKAAEVDALGLDGTGILEWMKAHAVEVPQAA